MRGRVFFAIAAAIVSVLSRSALADSTNLVYTFGGSFRLSIPADPAATKGWMQDALILVPQHLNICDLDVFVNITHTSAFDLQLYLRSPAGKTVTLNVSDPFEGYYEGEDYRSTTFDDEADTAIADAMPPFTGRFRPLESLAAFDDRDANGPWSLRVYDAYYGDTGCLDYFALIVTAPGPVDAVTIPVPAASGLALLGLGLLGPALRRLRGVYRQLGK